MSALLRMRRRGKILAALERIASALERIAGAQEEQSQLSQRGGFRSARPAPDEKDGADFLSQSDEDFAFLDELEDKRARAGKGVGLEEDLEDEYAGLPRGDREERGAPDEKWGHE